MQPDATKNPTREEFNIKRPARPTCKDQKCELIVIKIFLQKLMMIYSDLNPNFSR